MKIKKTKIKVIVSDIAAAGTDLVVNDVDAPSPMDQEKVRASCANGLNDVTNMAAESIAFPVLGFESGFPPVGAAKILTQEILRYLNKGETPLKEIIVCTPDDELKGVFEKQMSSYIDHLLNTLGEEPYQTVDIIIELDEAIILIERSNPPYGWALPGGFIDKGEETQAAAVREAKEETNMDLDDIRTLKTYDAPDRDPRFHTISTVFIAKGVGTPQFGDDAKGLQTIPYSELLNREYAFDHKQVIQDYLDQR